ncbi:hypothetical protein IQ268_29660 [Oculatella sp. LEGE 06141]|nr:hypothetical protein [Oculatella sp. LEGE 06141]MBE9182707.1 hypothetical protein [Oculatella sp. LEGE 06141]
MAIRLVLGRMGWLYFQHEGEPMIPTVEIHLTGQPQIVSCKGVAVGK